MPVDHSALSQHPGQTTFHKGDLLAKTHFRTDAGDSRGPCLEVHAQLKPGEWKEILRYDCFDKMAHRHHFYADGREDRVYMNTEGIQAAIEYTQRDLEGHVRDLARSFGLGEWAERVPAEDEREAMGQMLAAMRADAEREGAAAAE